MRELNVTKVLKMLTGCVDASFVELEARCTDIEPASLEAAIQYLIRTKQVSSEPVRYSVTAAGVVGLGKRMESQQKGEEKAARRAAFRLKRQQQPPKLARLPSVSKTVTMVEQSIRSNPNSVFALGGAHA